MERMVGRARELAVLVESVIDGGGRGAVVSGPAGVGKSALVRVAGDQLAGAALTVQRVRATRAVATIPFGAFVRFVPTTGAMPIHPIEALARLTNDLLATAGDGRLLVAIDDAHLLDDGSAALVHALVEGGAAVLATVRSGEPLADAIAALRKDFGVLPVELGPLDRDALEQLAVAELGGPLGPDLGAKLWALSGGHPLFACELLRSGRQQGVIVEDDGCWTWTGALPRSEVLLDVLRDHLDDAGPQVRAVVEVVALGEPLSLTALARIVAVVDISHAEQGGLVAVDEGDAVRLAHPLFGELVRLELGRARTTMIASALADAVGAVDGAREVLRVASWQLQASAATADPALLYEAARRASHVGDPQATIRFAAAAVERGAHPEAATLLADALYFAGRFDDVAALYDRYAHDPATPSRTRRLIRMSQASAQFWGRGEVAPALATLEAGLDDLDPDDRQEAEAHHASICLFAGAVGETVDRLERLLADEALSPGARIRAGTLAATGLALTGRVGDALRRAEESFAACLTAPQPDDLAGFLGGALMSRAMALITGGRLGEAEEAVRTLAEMAGAQRQALFVGPLHLLLGRIVALRGRIDEAVAELDVADAAPAIDAGGMLGWTRAMRAKAIAQSAHPEAAEAALAAVQAVRHPAAGLFELDVGLAEAWTHNAAGRRTAARERAGEVARQAEDGGTLVVAAEAWHDLARLGAPRDAVAPLAQLAAAVEGPLVVAWSDHATALAAQDAAALDRAAAQLEAVGLLLHAAEAAADAALLHERDGRRGSALTSVAHARRLRALCPGAGGVPGDVGVPLHHLTEREREIAELAARGQSNREIADQLFLSIRTVNNHLNHVYTKLGFSDRQRLAVALDQPE